MQKTTKTNFRKILKLVLWAGLIIFCINLIIKYPVHRHIGFDRMYKYMDMQKIPRSDIKSVSFQIHKNGRLCLLGCVKRFGKL